MTFYGWIKWKFINFRKIAPKYSVEFFCSWTNLSVLFKLILWTHCKIFTCFFCPLFEDFVFMYMCVSVCWYVHVNTHGGYWWSGHRVPWSQLWVVVSSLTWVLRTRLWSSVGEASATNRWAILPAAAHFSQHGYWVLCYSLLLLWIKSAFITVS